MNRVGIKASLVSLEFYEFCDRKHNPVYSREIAKIKAF